MHAPEWGWVQELSREREREESRKISDGRRLDLGGMHTVQCRDDVFWNCAPETCVILLTSVTTIKFNKKEKENKVEIFHSCYR